MVEDCLEIRVASTETRLIQGLVNASSMDKFQGIEIARSAMEVGDIGIYYHENKDDTTSEEGKVLFLIERKSYADLQASFKDGRYQEQSIRLRTHPELSSPRQVVYLLEIGLAEESGLTTDKRIQWFRTQSSLLMKPGHDFLIFQTRSPEESALAILSFASKVLEIIRTSQKDQYQYPEQALPYFMQTQSVGFTELCEAAIHDRLIETMVVQMKKQSNLTPDMFFVALLGGIPNVGSEMAKAIAAKFGSLNTIMEQARENKSTFLQTLQELKYGSTARQSSIGEQRAQTIYQYLMPSSEFVVPAKRKKGPARDDFKGSSYKRTSFTSSANTDL
jgi:ERCC4-type nuclease